MSDSDPAAIPHFGRKAQGPTYTDRPGSYAVIRNPKGRLAVVHVQTIDGFYLPGGGADPGESSEATLVREVREECGLTVRIVRAVGRAVQYVITASGQHVAKQCVYYEAAVVPGGECAATEADHVLCWMRREEALSVFVLEADAWAIQQVMPDDRAGEFN